MNPDRASIWKRFGAPADQVGSVNEPRVRREHGFDWNEKWIYRGADGSPTRLVLWNRYDLVAVLAIAPDGSAKPEPAA